MADFKQVFKEALKQAIKEALEPFEKEIAIAVLEELLAKMKETEDAHG